LSFSEFQFLFSFLPAYYDYMRQQPNTLLVRFYATFMSRGQYYIIMNNIFCGGLGLPLEKYDLKGAVSNRYTPEEYRTTGRTLKDGDFIDSKRKIYVPRHIYKVLSQQIKSDVSFLASQNVMDYSLLAGISWETGEVVTDEEFEARIATQPVPPNHVITKSLSEMLPNWLVGSSDNHKDKEENTSSSSVVVSPVMSPVLGRSTEDAEQVPTQFRAYNPDKGRVEHVCLGVIDMFMYYHVGRDMFSKWRALTEDAQEISTVAPQEYADRFHLWMLKNVLCMEPKK